MCATASPRGRPPLDTGSSSGDAPGSSSGAASGSGSGSSSNSGSGDDASATEALPPGYGQESDEGCGCRSGGTFGPGVLVIMVPALRRRRRA